MQIVSGLLIFCLLILSKNADSQDSPVYQATHTHVYEDKIPSRGVLHMEAHLKGWTHNPDSAPQMIRSIPGLYDRSDFIISASCFSSSLLTFQNGSRFVTMSTQVFTCSLTPGASLAISNSSFPNNCLINSYTINSSDYTLTFHGTMTVRNRFHSVLMYPSFLFDCNSFSDNLRFFVIKFKVCTGAIFLPFALWLCFTLFVDRNVRCFTDETYSFSVKDGLSETKFQSTSQLTPLTPIADLPMSKLCLHQMLRMYVGAKYYYCKSGSLVLNGYVVYNGKVSPSFTATNKHKLRKFFIEWLSVECTPTPQTRFHAPPVVLSELSGGFIPESVALHVAETFALYALQLWRAPTNSDRALIFILMYKHLRSDKDLPFRDYTETKWKELVALFTAYVTALITSNSKDEIKLKQSFANADVEEMENAIFQAPLGSVILPETTETSFHALGDSPPPASPFSSSDILTSTVSSIKGVVQSKLVHTTIFLTTSIALLISGVPISNLSPYMERLPLHMQTIQTLTVVEQLTSTLTWVKDTGIKLVTGQFKTWSDVFPTLDITQWAEVATVRIRNNDAILRALATDNQDLELEGLRVGNIHEQVRLLHDIWNQGQSHLRRIKMTQYASGKKLLEEKIVHIRGIYDALLLDLRSQATRKSPMGILLFGASSIGKTSLTAFIQHWHAEVLGLPSGDEYVYTLNPTAEFWDGFRSYKHTLVLDDIGSVKASVGEDQGIITIIRTINNVPFVPNMASLEDKGAHPFLGRLVIATSNDKGFCAAHRTNNPEALQRRLKFVITPTLREGFVEDGSFKLPSGTEKIDENNSPWDFVVEAANIILGSTGYVITYKNLATEERTFKGPNALIDLRSWLTTSVLEHDKNQENFLRSKKALLECKFCREHEVWGCKCKLPVQGCAEAPQQVTVLSKLKNLFPNSLKRRLVTSLPAVAPIAVVAVPPMEETEITEVVDENQLVVKKTTFGTYVRGLFVPTELQLSKNTAELVRTRSSQITRFQAAESTTALSVSMQYVFVPVGISMILYTLVWPRVRPSVMRFYAWLSLCLYYYYTCQSMMFWYNTSSARAYRLMDSLSSRLPSTKIMLCVAMITGALTIVIMSQSWANTTKFQMDDTPNDKGFYPPRNVWTGGNVVSSLSSASKTLCGRSFGDKLHALKRNIVRVRVTCKGKEAQSAVGLSSGQYLLFSRHALADYDATEFDIEIRFPLTDGRQMESFSIKQGLKRDVSWTINPERDLVLVNMVDVRSVDVFKYMFEVNNHTALPQNMFALTERSDGVEQIPLVPKSFSDADVPQRITKLHQRYGVGTTRVCQYKNDTKALQGGDSGALIVGQFVNGLAIIGLHTGGAGIYPHYDGHSMTLSYAIVKEMMDRITLVDFNAMGIPSVVVDAGEPALLTEQGIVEVYSGSMSRFCPLAPFEGAPAILSTNMTFVGSLLRSFRTNDKSQVHKTPYCARFKPLALAFDCENTKVAPVFNWLSKRHFLTTVSSTSNHQIVSELNAILVALFGHFKANCPKHEYALLKPLTLQQAINGEVDCIYLDRMNMATSAGRPYNRCKKEVLVATSDGNWTLPPNLKSAHNMFIKTLKHGVRTNLPFKASLKDEPIDPKKLSMVEPRGKGPRLFMASNMDLTILIRMFYLPYARIAQRNPFLFMSAPGMNCTSSIWFALHNFLTAHGGKNIMAGDYSGFDVRMMSLITHYAFLFMQAVLFSGGNYTEEMKIACYTLMYDIINPNCEIDGDHFLLYGTNPSGHPLTVHVNCIANIMYIMFTFIKNGGSLGQFFHDVKVITYGDDNVLGIRDPSILNYLTMRDTLHNIGVVYTRADKSAIVGQDLDDIYDIEFLKRKFKLATVRGKQYCFCPLDRKSLFKTLDIWMRSKIVVEKEQARDSLSAVWQGTLMYDDMEAVRAEIESVICDYLGHLPANLFPTFDTFMDNYDASSASAEKFFHYPCGGEMFSGSLYTLGKRFFIRRILMNMPKDMVYLPPEREEVRYCLTWLGRFFCVYFGQCALNHVLRQVFGKLWATIAAWIEEVLYFYIGPFGRLIFALCEFVDYVATGVPWYTRLPALFMHFGCAFLPFWLSTTVHCTFNHLCMVLPPEVVQLFLNPHLLWRVISH